MNFQIPENTTLTLGAKKYSGIALRADAEIRFLENQKITAGFLIEPLASLLETGGSLGTPTGATVIGVHLGWNRQMIDQLWLRIGMRYDVASGSYDGNSSTVNDKRFAIGPGIYYLF